MCLAAGLAERRPHAFAQALPDDCPEQPAVHELIALGVQRCVDAGVRHSPLGAVAEALRIRFCGGEAAVLLRADMKARIYNAFAGLAVGDSARTEAMYTRWVQRLATREFADELVVLCVALELAVRIAIVPYAPPHALGQWAISAYGPEGADVVLHLGNNDVHYVYLSQGPR